MTDAFETAPNYEAEHVGTSGDFEVYDGGSGFFLHGVADGRAIEIDRLRRNDVDSSEIESVVDAGEGDAETIADRHDGVATIADRLRPRHLSSLGPANPDREAEPANGDFRGVTASGASAQVRGAETHARVILTFRDEAALEAADTEQWVAESWKQPNSSELTIETDGRILTAELTTPTGVLLGSESD